MKNFSVKSGNVVIFILLGFIFFFGGCSFLSQKNLNSLEERTQVVDQYLSEFCSGALRKTKIGASIREVLLRIPPDDLKIVLNRRRPVLFTEVYDGGTARFASSSEIIVFPEDKPAFQEGMTIVKISFALESAKKEEIMGIIAHELAHRVLDHVRKGKVSCESEREANRLIKAWGFGKEFTAASQQFGRKKEGGGVVSCQE